MPRISSWTCPFSSLDYSEDVEGPREDAGDATEYWCSIDAWNCWSERATGSFYGVGNCGGVSGSIEVRTYVFYVS